MTDINQIFPNTGYLKAENVDESGEQVRTIVRAEEQEVDYNGTVSTRIIVELEPEMDWACRLSLTAAGARSVAEAVGSTKLDEWTGREVELYATDVFGFGKTHHVIRARAAQGLA